ncbi:hypothetical protein JEQ12_009758 [Ovis aries]|uniref:C2 domain-containing protein n=1 Tax=Ovis aries TaxID=9940 RepID=A0A836AMG6_SHEEP|nr:hypothetical protein JEQ12_009758 [Ovis aries]
MEPPQDMAEVSNTEDNHNRRIHSLYAAPLFQRISQTNLENRQARGLEFSSTAWNVQGRDKTPNLSKVESKEGPGYRLLNMLRKTLKGSENKEPEVTHEAPSLVPFGDVVGCLAIHVRNCKHFTPKIISQHYSNLFIRISINNVVKCTKTCSLLSQNTEKDFMITFDEVKYFSVQVPRCQDDEKNNIRLELMQHDSTKKYLLLLGSVQVHLYEVIQKGCFTGELQMLNKNTFICRVEVEFMFSYGNFGYGFSHQLKPLQKIIKPSMFMDIAPPPERTDPVTNVIIPQPIAYPAFLSPDLNVTVGAPTTASQSNQPAVVQLEKLQQQPRERLEKMKKEYRHLSTWAEKASYLEGLLTPGLEHKEPKESNINEILESQLEERPTDTVTSGISLIKEEAETIPSELLDNDDKKGLTLPTLNQSSKDDSSVVAPKTDMPSKETDTPLSTIPRLSITEENQIPPLEEHQQEAMPVKKMKNLFFLPEEKLKDRYPSLLKSDSYPLESSSSYCCTKENLSRPCSLDALLESGIIKVIELDKEYQKGFLLDTEAAFAEEKPKDSTEYYSEIRGKAEPLSDQNSAIIHQETTSSFKRVEFIDKGQNTSPHDSKYQLTSDKKSDLPSNGQRLDREENDTSSTLENLSTSLMGKFNDCDVIMLKSFLKNIFNFFFKYNQSENRPPEKELERLIQHPFPNKTEDLEEIEENFDKADKLDRKPVLNPKLRIFLEELSESEIKNLKSELSKHVQHYLVEKLSESGHITKEDLPKIYQNLYLMNEKVEPKGQNIFLEKYSETVKEIMSFVNNFNHHFIDKHLEIKLRSFLNEILQNYFLKNLSDNSLFKEKESDPMCSKVSSLRAQSASISFQELGQDTLSRSFGSRLEINMKYPLNKSLQSYLIALSENEILDLKADLSKHLQSLFIEKLSKSGLITERQLEGISQHINLVNFSSTPLKCIKPDLSLRDENQFVAEHSEKQNKYSKIAQKTTLQKVPEDRLVETELTKKEEKEVFSLENIKENPPIIQEQKRHSQEAKTLRLIKVQPCSNENTQVIPLNKSLERLTDTVPNKKKKEHGFMQFPHEENFEFKTETQDQHNWSGKSKTTQSKACFEKTLKVKSLDKKDHNNTYKVMVQEKPEAVLSPKRIPDYKMPNEDEEYVNKFTFPSRQNNNLTCLISEAREKSKLEDQYRQRLKGNNNNNKKQHLEIFAHYKEEIQTLYTKPNELCNEKYAWVPESQLLKILVAEKNSKPSLFPEVLKKENLKPKVRKERDRVSKQKKSFNKIVNVLPTIPPSTGIHLRKSVPRTLLHWTARKTTHVIIFF